MAKLPSLKWKLLKKRFSEGFLFLQLTSQAAREKCQLNSSIVFGSSTDHALDWEISAFHRNRAGNRVSLLFQASESVLEKPRSSKAGLQKRTTRLEKHQWHFERIKTICSQMQFQWYEAVEYCHIVNNRQKAVCRATSSWPSLTNTFHPSSDHHLRWSGTTMFSRKAFGPKEIAVLSGCFQHQWREVVAQLVPAICATLGAISSQIMNCEMRFNLWSPVASKLRPPTEKWDCHCHPLCPFRQSSLRLRF